MDLEATEIPQSKCCECGHTSNRVGGFEVPEPGAFILCIRCGCLNILAENSTLRAPTDDEIFAAATDRDLQTLRSIILDFNASSTGKTGDA